MKFAVAALVGAVNASSFLGYDNTLTEVDYEFFSFISKHGKSYGTREELEFRKQVFQETYEFVKEWNAGNNSHEVEVNFLADWTYAEKKRLNGFVPTQVRNPVRIAEKNAGYVNWVDEGAVTPVKNQGQCGSCWAFSTTGAVEGADFLATKTLNSYSEQQLVDCAGGSYGNLGCNGGDMDAAFKYIEDNGIELESAYPYKGVDGTCKADKSKSAGAVKNFNDVPAKDVSQMNSYVQQGPVSVAIEADKLVFQMYRSGVMDTSRCGTNLDHGVLVVGFGNESGKDYYLVKNSWGTTWGDKGYVKIAANADDTCGILDSASQPTD